MPVRIRCAAPEWESLVELLLHRYPHEEWASFVRFGWHESRSSLTLTLAAIDRPSPGEMDDEVAHVVFREPYTLRVALGADQHPLALGVINSHPENCAPAPSCIDDDMDAYLSSYFSDFAPGRPYVSLILARHGTQLVMSGRAWWRGSWHCATSVHVERASIECWLEGRRPTSRKPPPSRVARLTSAFGVEASCRLANATVAVIGAGGTGSAAIETLARAGVGHLIVVDPDHLEDSNLERVHGSAPEQAGAALAKVIVAREHVREIAPTCEVSAFVGRLPQDEIVEALLAADVVLGCTDSHHSRLALSDLAVRYLLPAIDSGVALEGRDGRVSGQIIQLVRYLAADPCAWCRAFVDPVRLAQELMSPEESARRRIEAASAQMRGEAHDSYWREERQLNTVGYLTTQAGAMAAGYAIGWITGRFDPPFSRIQLNLVAPALEVIDIHDPPRDSCSCRRVRGWADQARADALISAPTHWPAVQRPPQSTRRHGLKRHQP